MWLAQGAQLSLPRRKLTITGSDVDIRSGDFCLIDVESKRNRTYNIVAWFLNYLSREVVIEVHKKTVLDLCMVNTSGYITCFMFCLARKHTCLSWVKALRLRSAFILTRWWDCGYEITHIRRNLVIIMCQEIQDSCCSHWTWSVSCYLLFPFYRK